MVFNPLARRNKDVAIQEVNQHGNCMSSKVRELVYALQKGDIAPTDFARMDRYIDDIKGIADKMKTKLHGTIIS